MSFGCVSSNEQDVETDSPVVSAQTPELFSPNVGTLKISGDAVFIRTHDDGMSLGVVSGTVGSSGQASTLRARYSQCETVTVQTLGKDSMMALFALELLGMNSNSLASILPRMTQGLQLGYLDLRPHSLCRIRDQLNLLG